MSTIDAPGYRWTREGPHLPVTVGGRRVCEVPGCTRPHCALGLCHMHYKRAKVTGDPLKASRFASEAEKRAFVERERAQRRAMRAAYWRQRQVEAESRRVLGEAARRRVRPEAKALVAALDAMPMDERAAVATEIVGVLLGRPVDLTRPPASTDSARNGHASNPIDTTDTDTDSTDTHERPTP